MRQRERKGAKIGYVTHQNITVESWRHWFPRHACTVHLLDARWRTQCPQLATHSATVTFFSCWLLRPIRSGERHKVGRPFEHEPWRLRSSGQSHAPTTKHGRVSVTTILSFACFFGMVGRPVSAPRFTQLMLRVIGRWEQTNSGCRRLLPTPFPMWPSHQGRGSESRVLYRGTSSSRECSCRQKLWTSSYEQPRSSCVVESCSSAASK